MIERKCDVCGRWEPRDIMAQCDACGIYLCEKCIVWDMDEDGEEVPFCQECAHADDR